MREVQYTRSPWLAVLTATVAAMLAVGGIAHGGDATASEPQDTSDSASDSAASHVTIRIGDREVTCVPEPRVRGGHVLVPLSFVTDCLGGSVSYDDGTGTWTLSLAEHSLLVRTWQRHFVYDGRRGEAVWAPELLNDTLFIPLWTLSHGFELDATFSQTADGGVISCRQLPGALRDIRCGAYPEKTRVVLDLDILVSFSWEQEDDGTVVVRLPPPPAREPVRRRFVRVDSEWVQNVQQKELSDRSIEVRIATKGEVAPEVFTLGNPARIVVDIGSAERPVVEEGVQTPGPEQLGPAPPAEGIRLEERRFGTAGGPVRVNVLYVDLRHPEVRVQPALAADTIPNKARPSAIAQREGAYAAANGGFFAPRGEPLGMLVINGEWISHPIYGRAVLGILDDGRALIDNVQFGGSVELGGIGTLRLTGINLRHQQAPELIAYSRRWGEYVPRPSGATHVAITDTGLICQVQTQAGETFVPPGGWVLSGTGANAAQLANAQLNTRADLRLAATPDWPGLRQAIGGGPRLVKDGRPHVTAEQERFRTDVRLGAAPRTAVGIDADGRLMLVTADGGGASGTRGMTLAELASTMAKLGARDAMNLDGGSSSTLAVGSRVVNKPSTGWERAVSNALLVFAGSRTPVAEVASGQ